MYYVRITANDGRIGYAPFIVRPRRSARRAESPSSSRRTRGRRTTSATPTATAGGTRGRERRPEHGRARTRVHPQGGAAAVAQVRRRLPALALLDGEDAGHHHGVRPRGDPDRRRADPPLRLRHLRRPHRVRDAARVRPDRGLSQPRRQPRLPLGEQLLLGGAPAGPRLRRTRLWRRWASRRRRCWGCSIRANDDGRLQRPFIVPLGDDGALALAGTASWTAPPSARSSAATGSRSTRRRRSRPPARSCSPTSATLRPGLTAQMTYYETTVGAKVFAQAHRLRRQRHGAADQSDAREPVGAPGDAVSSSRLDGGGAGGAAPSLRPLCTTSPSSRPTTSSTRRRAGGPIPRGHATWTSATAS